MGKKFFIVEDHSLMRYGIATWINENSDWECAGMAQSKSDAMEKIKNIVTENKDSALVVIADITLDAQEYDYSGLELIKDLSAYAPDIKTICFSMYKNPGIIQMALNNGASGYVSKTCSEEELLECMEAVLKGNIFIEKNLNSSVETYVQAVSSLTKREAAVLELILKHKNNDEIARVLNIQKRAVESYTSRIYDKTGCKNRNDLITFLG